MTDTCADDGNERPARMERMRWQFWIDVGGTFTDCVAQTPTGELRLWKTLSSGVIKGRIERRIDDATIHDPLRRFPVADFWKGWQLRSARRNDAPFVTTIVSSSTDGTLQLADPWPGLTSGEAYELYSGEEAPVICLRCLLGRRLDEPLPAVDVRLGTTRGTNALLERKGAATGLLVTHGFADLLRIGNQDRPDLFALDITKPEPLYHSVLEVRERITADGTVLIPLDEDHLRSQLRILISLGIDSLAISLLHAYRNEAHECRIEEIAREEGFVWISRSSATAPVIKAVPRTETTVLDAYLTPVLRAYLDGISARLGPGSTLKIMGSQGGLLDAAAFSGKDSMLSGPAGGVIAFAAVAREAGFEQSIGFDMGGTSTDVARFGGRLEMEHETVKAGVRIATPTLSIETVAAGGGSVCWFDGVQLRVGPQSAGADPGPACFGRGGPLTVTDANVALGRIPTEGFPFPLDTDAIDRRLDEIREAVARSTTAIEYTREQLAQGFLEIANERMARAIRTISVRKGFNPADHPLVSFGGAGGQHACALARILGMRTLLIHPYAGVLSAYGMGLADVRRSAERTVLLPLNDESLRRIGAISDEMGSRLRRILMDEGMDSSALSPPEVSLSLRYAGVEAAIDVPTPIDGNWRDAYESLHQRYFGYRRSDCAVQIVAVAVEVVGRLQKVQVHRPHLAASPPVPRGWGQVHHGDRRVSTPVFRRCDLACGHRLEGPAIVQDEGSTLWLEPGFTLGVLESGTLRIDSPRQPGEIPSATNAADETADPIRLEVFHNQFASIAEQMGATLRKTSVSTNVKERLDYSCAIFDAAGGLVVNAPHIPVHLGAMGETVRCLLRDNPKMRPGDVYLTNDPYAGGSHLPDLTVVTPVHDRNSGDLLFLTACRAHHAEIGGSTPGSMPPFSTTLAEEGVLLSNFKLMDAGRPRWDELREILTSGPYPTRNVQDNLADLAAQTAANRLGEILLHELMERSGRTAVVRYMGFIQDAAERKTRQALKRLRDGIYSTVDYLDDGSPIAVAIAVRGDEAEIDFTGTGPVLPTNLNANRAIVTAAVMYVFRCLVDEPIPLNGGSLKPLTIVLPECLLNPSAGSDPARRPAVVGGNVETSQRIVDVLLGGLGVAAASQGTMNNLTFGDGTFGYYETICGGAGATPLADGADAVHTHMTNTRLTDVEVLEHRYPVRVEEFSIRRGSGGLGRHSGGNGVRRVLRFLKPVQVSLLTQRRGAYPPFGLHGGMPGKTGRNLLVRMGQSDVQDLGGAASVAVAAGDCLIIETPGGGGFGTPELIVPKDPPMRSEPS